MPSFVFVFYEHSLGSSRLVVRVQDIQAMSEFRFVRNCDMYQTTYVPRAHFGEVLYGLLWFASGLLNDEVLIGIYYVIARKHLNWSELFS